jgi:hypothetical protein
MLHDAEREILSLIELIAQHRTSRFDHKDSKIKLARLAALCAACALSIDLTVTSLGAALDGPLDDEGVIPVWQIICDTAGTDATLLEEITEAGLDSIASAGVGRREGAWTRDEVQAFTFGVAKWLEPRFVEVARFEDGVSGDPVVLVGIEHKVALCYSAAVDYTSGLG